MQLKFLRWWFAHPNGIMKNVDNISGFYACLNVKFPRVMPQFWISWAFFLFLFRIVTSNWTLISFRVAHGVHLFLNEFNLIASFSMARVSNTFHIYVSVNSEFNFHFLPFDDQLNEFIDIKLISEIDDSKSYKFSNSSFFNVISKQSWCTYF